MSISKWGWGLAVVLVMTVASGVAHGEEDPLAAVEAYEQGLFQQVAQSVIFISSGGGFGSGFFVTDDGLALTNKHVVGDAEEVRVVLQNGRRYDARVIERAEGTIDLALIHVPLESAEPLRLTGFEDLRVGSWVGSVGHGAGGIWTFTKGMVSNIYPAEESRPIFQTQIPLNPGASGGPVFDRRGRVVGVVTSGLSDTNSVNFAIRSDVALSSLEELAEQCHCLTINAPDGVPVFVNGTMVGTGPELVVQISDGEHEIFAVINGEMNKKTVAFPATREMSLP